MNDVLKRKGNVGKEVLPDDIYSFYAYCTPLASSELSLLLIIPVARAEYRSPTGSF